VDVGAANDAAARRLDDVLLELRMLDEDAQPAAALALAVPLLRQLDSVARGVYADELLKGALGVERGQLERWLAAPGANGGNLMDELWRHLLPEEKARQRARREARRQLEREERGDEGLPTLATLRALLAAPRPEVRWTIPKWQPADSRVMLAAQYKAGKTTAVGNLLRSLVDGDDWLGVATVTPIAGTVALLDTEMSEGMLLDWLADQRIVADDRVVPVALRGRVGALDLLDNGRRGEWVALLREAGARYLVLDCLRPVLDALALDEHRDAGRFLVALDALLTAAGIADCLVVHHMGHAGERSRGDSRLRDWPDAEWRLVRQGDEDDPAAPRYITAYGRDVDQGETLLHHDPTTRRLTAVGGTRRDVAEREAVEAVVAAVEAAGEPLSTAAVERAIAGQVARDRARTALSQAVREGLIITEAGPRGATLHRFVQRPRGTSRPARGASVAQLAGVHPPTGGVHSPREVPRGSARPSREQDEEVTDAGDDGELEGEAWRGGLEI
jgi:hypothetical protein